MTHATPLAGGVARGISLYLACMLLFACQDILAKHLASHYPPLMVVWARYTSQFALTLLIFLPWLHKYLRTNHIGLQLIRSAFLFGATFCFFNSFKHMQLSTSIAIFEIAPLVITAMSVVILKESVGIRRWIGVGVGMIGALVIIRPGSDVFTFAALWPIGAACCFAGYSISTRFLSSDEPAMTSFVYTALIGTIAATLMVPAVWVTPDWGDVPFLAVMGVFGGIGHYVLIIALTLAPASLLAPFSYAGLIFASVFAFIVFGEVPDRYTILGAVIIVGAGLYVWWRERQKSDP